MCLSKTQRQKLERLIRTAQELKPKLQCRRQFHLCAIYSGKELLALACNSNKTHPKKQIWYPKIIDTQHAEFAAIMMAKRKDFTGCAIYVIRIDNNGEPANSAPCIYCANLIAQSNFDYIIHT